MKRLTKEWINQIKEIKQSDREACHWGHVGDLLNEIDALKAELKMVTDTVRLYLESDDPTKANYLLSEIVNKSDF